MDGVINKGYVYIFYSPGSSRYKIGESKNPATRHQQGKTWHPNLKIIKTYPFLSKKVAQKKEKALHREFKSKRIDNDHEWFNLNEVDLIRIDEFLNGGGRMSFGRRIFLKIRIKWMKYA